MEGPQSNIRGILTSLTPFLRNSFLLIKTQNSRSWFVRCSINDLFRTQKGKSYAELALLKRCTCLQSRYQIKITNNLKHQLFSLLLKASYSPPLLTFLRMVTDQTSTFPTVSPHNSTHHSDARTSRNWSIPAHTWGKRKLPSFIFFKPEISYLIPVIPLPSTLISDWEEGGGVNRINGNSKTSARLWNESANSPFYWPAATLWSLVIIASRTNSTRQTKVTYFHLKGKMTRSPIKRWEAYS